MTIALKIRILDLCFEFITNTLILRFDLQSARSVTFFPFQPFLNSRNDFMIFVQTHFTHLQRPFSTTIYLWLISLTASKELSILLLKLYNDGAIGISNTFLDSASVIKTDNQLLIRSVRFMQVESP